MNHFPVDQVLDDAKWQVLAEQTPSEDGTPHATHRGELTIAGKKLVLFQLSDGRRVIEAKSLGEFVT